MKTRTTVLGAVLVASTLLPVALAAPPAYTKAQATAGAKTYTAQCAACHGAKLSGGGGPALTGSNFLKKWAANTVDDFYYIESTTMPQTHPGALKEVEYVNVLAYILQQNGFKPGSKALAVKDLKSYTFKK